MLNYVQRNPRGAKRLSRPEMLRLADIAERGEEKAGRLGDEDEAEFARYIKSIIDYPMVHESWERGDAGRIWPVLVAAGWTAGPVAGGQ